MITFDITFLEIKLHEKEQKIFGKVKKLTRHIFGKTSVYKVTFIRPRHLQRLNCLSRLTPVTLYGSLLTSLIIRRYFYIICCLCSAFVFHWTWKTNGVSSPWAQQQKIHYHPHWSCSFTSLLIVNHDFPNVPGI